MSELILPIWAIAAAFLLIAMSYAAVGLGGGSSYAALMILFGFSSASIPNLSLLLNLIVTTVGCYNFIRRGHLQWSLLAPFLLVLLGGFALFRVLKHRMSLPLDDATNEGHTE